MQTYHVVALIALALIGAYGFYYLRSLTHYIEEVSEREKNRQQEEA